MVKTAILRRLGGIGRSILCILLVLGFVSCKDEALPDAGIDLGVDAAPDMAPPDLSSDATKDASIPDLQRTDAKNTDEWTHVLENNVTVGDIVSRFAPVFYHDTDTGGPDQLGAKAGYVSAVDFDGDRQHNNNWENLVTAKALPAHVYYSVVATKTHYFITYSVYHPRDWEKICTGLFTECHEGDLESSHVVVRRDQSGYGLPILVWTAAHGRLSFWSNTGDGVKDKQAKLNGPIDFEDAQKNYSKTATTSASHARIYIQERGHGPIACRANEKPPTLGYFGFLEGVNCPAGASWDKGYHQKTGITFRFARGQATVYQPSMSNSVATANYDLLSTLQTLYSWRLEIGANKLFRSKDQLTYSGARGGVFAISTPIGVSFDAKQFVNDSSSGVAPWSRELKGSNRGDLFFDPAYALSQGFSFDHSFSTSYVYHPYLPNAVSP